MQKETKLQEVLRCTLESLRDKEYSEETLKRYQKKFHCWRRAILTIFHRAILTNYHRINNANAPI